MFLWVFVAQKKSCWMKPSIKVLWRNHLRVRKGDGDGKISLVFLLGSIMREIERNFWSIVVFFVYDFNDCFCH